MNQSSVDEQAYGAPLIFTTLFNSISLNDYLIEVKRQGLDEDQTFKADLRDLVANRQSELNAISAFGEDSEPCTVARSQHERSAVTLLEFFTGPSNEAVASGIQSPA